METLGEKQTQDGLNMALTSESEQTDVGATRPRSWSGRGAKSSPTGRVFFPPVLIEHGNKRKLLWEY